jgi:hypothetical protein
MLGADEMVSENAFFAAYATVDGQRVAAGRIMTSELDPVICGSSRPLLLDVTGHGDRSRDFFALAAAWPEVILSSLLIELDTALKKLARAAGHFGQQRRTIAAERAEVDLQVGAVLHQQVMSTAEASPETGMLEENIASLSRMFGVLATDSLLVRRAEDLLGQNLRSLEESLNRLLSKEEGALDQIGAHYRGVYTADLDAAHLEIKDLAFSRQSAQAAIEVVRTQVELLRAGEEAAIQGQTKELLSRSLLLQQERLALQVAAGFVEFVLVFYYVLKSWEGIVGQELVEHIAPVIRLLVVAGTAGGAAVGTHFLARALQKGTWRNTGLWISVAVMSVSLLAMVILTITLT